MLDITGANTVELQVRGDGKVVWVNVDGVCALRICRIDEVIVNDERLESEAYARLVAERERTI